MGFSFKELAHVFTIKTMANFDIEEVAKSIEQLPPIKGYSEVDMMRKDIARDLAVGKKKQAELEPLFLKAERSRQREEKKAAKEFKHQDVRKFHNSIKSGLYKRAWEFADLGNNTRDPRTRKWKYKNTLLELACGRGGDIHKWKHTGYRYVAAVDKDSEAVDEAKQRVKNVNLRDVRIDFGFMDLERASENKNMTEILLNTFPRSPWYYDTVSIQFAIQYLCKDDKTLIGFLETVSNILRPGGTFVGTFPDGSNIVELLGGSGEFDNGFLKIAENSDGSPGISFFADFGRGDSYFDSRGTSKEYPVFWGKLSSIACSMGFVLLEHKGFLEYKTEDHVLLPEEAEFSGVFKSFIFKKHQNTQYFPSGHSRINWDSLKIDKVGKYSISRPHDSVKIHSVIMSEYLKLSKGKRPSSICDGTACVGGDTIGLSRMAEQVYAWEIEQTRCDMLKNNLEVYNINNVTVYNESFMNSTGACDILYIDPPWGGPGYDSEEGKVELYLGGVNVKDVIESVKERFKMIVVKVPYNYNFPREVTIYNISRKISIWVIRS